MTSQRVIRLYNQTVALTELASFPLSSTSLKTALRLDGTEAISFFGPDNSPLYWLVEATYDSHTQTVSVIVLDYETKPVYQSAFRKDALTKPVQEIRFALLDEKKMRLHQTCIRFDRPALLPHLLLDPATERSASLPSSPPSPPFSVAELNRLGRVWDGPGLSNFPLTWTDRFRSRFDEATFETGMLTGWRDKAPLGRAGLRFEVHNEHLRPEYEYICRFITRKLGRETFDVYLTVTEYADGSCTGVATSPQVARIDAALIDAFHTTRAQRVRQRREGPTNGQQTYTLDEVLALTREPGEPAGLLTPAELQHRLITDARNRQQIEYLAATKQDTDTAVRFTFGHHVGFVFCILGATQRHYCWELLNSHATYVWSFPQAMSTTGALSQLEAQLREVNQSGRTEYRRLGAQPAADTRFAFVEHTLLNKTPGETFARWQQEMENLLR